MLQLYPVRRRYFAIVPKICRFAPESLIHFSWTSKLNFSRAVALQYHLQPFQGARSYQPQILHMEADRAETNIGQANNAELEPEVQEAVKHPRRRFIGRKTAAARAGTTTETTRELEGGLLSIVFQVIN